RAGAPRRRLRSDVAARRAASGRGLGEPAVEPDLRGAAVRPDEFEAELGILRLARQEVEADAGAVAAGQRADPDRTGDLSGRDGEPRLEPFEGHDAEVEIDDEDPLLVIEDRAASACRDDAGEAVELVC